MAARGGGIAYGAHRAEKLRRIKTPSAARHRRRAAAKRGALAARGILQYKCGRNRHGVKRRRRNSGASARNMAYRRHALVGGDANGAVSAQHAAQQRVAS